MVAINGNTKNSIDSMENVHDSFREDLLRNSLTENNDDDDIMYPR